MVKQTKVITRRKKFQEVDVPLIKGKIELIGDSVEDIDGKTIKLDLTRQLKGKSVEVVVKVVVDKNVAVAFPIKMKLMGYFIRRMIRKKISYVENSLLIPSQESMIVVKPFLITRKRVSRAVRKALRNRAKNWLEDYISQLSDNEVFNEILSNRLQKSLSLVLKKTYPLSLCEIRVLEIKRKLEKSEVPKKVDKKTVDEKKEDEDFIDQMAEIEAEKIKEAEDMMKETQKKAVEIDVRKGDEERKETEEMKDVIGIDDSGKSTNVTRERFSNSEDENESNDDEKKGKETEEFKDGSLGNVKSDKDSESSNKDENGSEDLGDAKEKDYDKDKKEDMGK
jgi:ribosomal protein S3AE